MRILFLVLLCFSVVFSGVKAQKLNHRLGYMLVQIDKSTNLESILAQNSSRFSGQINLDRTISKRLGIYLIRFDHSRIHEGKLLSGLRSEKGVLIAQYDHITTQRAEPNDPRLADQWQWINLGQTGGITDADIDVDAAWDITTGGVTAAGDTIVVAIIDDGLDYNHEDIAANVWINHHEIPDNGIDDDGNGYVDDIYGWNAYGDNPNVWGQNHGLQVAGMVGAVGNNQIGVVGVNWNVKLMTIVGGSPESAAIASYAYALEQRIQYNETNGEKGAFVVATNSSWGIDFGQPADAPLWCAFYDSLGVHGILSAGATANLNIDIDAVGDLPTGCPSEYLFSVTALNHNDERTFSAYGLTQVDFGAPGEDVLTTRRNNGYGTTSGTSFASPVTAGLVALLYSVPCAGFAALIHEDPSAAALYIRDLMFQGVKPIPGLETFTRFGGSLNAGNSVELMLSLCSECSIPFNINSTDITDKEATINWSLIDTVDAVNARYKTIGASVWDTLFDVSQPLVLTDLFGCNDYEIEFESICADTSTGFISHYEFSTLGCCELPIGIMTFADESSVTMFWDEVLAADFYLVQWRPDTTGPWMEEVTSATMITIENLLACTYYQIRLQTNCDTSETGFSDLLLIRTFGCGNCIDLAYCTSTSDDASEEFIDSLVFGPLVNYSGNNGGYILYEDLNPNYRIGSTYNVWLRPGFIPGSAFDERFKIWIDLNQDGVFDESELMLDSLLLEEDISIATQITIPSGTPEGSTRMRVSMAFSSGFNPVDQEPCGPIDFGEIEDYCITIIDNPPGCPEVDTVHFDGITFTSAFMYWPPALGAIAYTYRYREVGTTEYEELATVDTTANIDGLEKCKSYEVQVRTVCLSDTTSYFHNYILETKCDVAVKELDPFLTSFDVFPNPVTDHVTVKFTPFETGDHIISIYSMQGNRIQTKIHYAESKLISTLRLEQIDGYPSGLYLVVVEKGGKTSTKKIVKM